jgi:hypothetical protein
VTAKFDSGLDILMSEMTQMQKERDDARAETDAANDRLAAASVDIDTLRRERDKHMRASSEWQHEVCKARSREQQLADLLHRAISRAKARDLHPEHVLVGEVRVALAATPPTPAAVEVAGREPRGAEWLCADRYRDLDARLAGLEGTGKGDGVADSANRACRALQAEINRIGAWAKETSERLARLEGESLNTTPESR